MGSELKTDMRRHIAKKFFGGEKRGVCLQITAADPAKDGFEAESFIQLDLLEASELVNTLQGFIKEEALRRQSLLVEELQDMKEVRNTIFNEVAELDRSFFEPTRCCVQLIESLCPKVRRQK